MHRCRDPWRNTVPTTGESPAKEGGFHASQNAVFGPVPGSRWAAVVGLVRRRPWEQRSKDRCRPERIPGIPVVITSGTGELKLTINESARTIDYVLTFANLQADITQAHIHIAQKSVNGGIVLWLCQTTGTPAPAAVAMITPFCDSTAGNTPCTGTVTGTLKDANALANATQQFAAGNLDDAFIALAAGTAYGNVHTVISGGGEIRGQLTHDHGRVH